MSSFRGYRRVNGQVGARNHIAILAAMVTGTVLEVDGGRCI